MPVKNAMTADFLRSAYGGESMAHMRYLIWGNVAMNEDMPNIGRLFQAIAYAEYAHADNHFRVLGEEKGDYTVAAGAVFGIGKTCENLQGAIDGELHEVNQMYPVYLETAKFQDEKGAKLAFYYALEAEKIHARLFQEAQNQAKDGKDMDIEEIYICPVCGFTHVGNPPNKCPVCGLDKDKIKVF